jgi:hypothetical protein
MQEQMNNRQSIMGIIGISLMAIAVIVTASLLQKIK